MADSSSTSSSNGLRELLLKLAILSAILLILDQVGGRALDHMYKQLDQGSFGPKVNMLIKQNTDIIIFGSSRAENQYIPEEIEKVSGLSAYNAGFGGQTILFHYGIMELYLKQHKPKAIIFDLNIDDLTSPLAQSSWDRLATLLPYADDPDIRELIYKRGKWEPIKLLSQIYPYNSNVLSIVKFTLKKGEPDKYAGYMPLEGSARMEKLIALADKRDAAEPDKKQPESGKMPEFDLTYLKRIIELTREKGIRLIVVNSPRWHKQGYYYTEAELKLFDVYRNELSQQNVPLIEITFEKYSDFEDYRLFYETIHLNADGARVFSRHLGAALKELGIK